MRNKSVVTKEEILEAIQDNNRKFFDGADDSYQNVEKVYSYNYGDGNELGDTYYFKDFDIYVNLEGVYSSWEGTEWNKCYQSYPYQFSETRYKDEQESADSWDYDNSCEDESSYDISW